MLAFFLTVFLAVFTVKAAVLDLPVPEGVRIIESDGIPEGYTESDIVWTGFEDQVMQHVDGVSTADPSTLAGKSFNGTIENVMQQLEALNFTMSMPENTTINAKPLTNHPRHHNCDIRMVMANLSAWDKGIWYLVGLSNSVKCTNQPRTCGRISCSYNSGIWWCNDQPSDMTYQCNSFAFYARELERWCKVGYYIKGENGDPSLGMRVLVARPWKGC